MTGRNEMNRKLICLALGLATFLAAMDLSAADTNETARLISADLQQTKGPLDTMFKFCVGAGRANEGLRADWQRQMTYAHRELGFEYMRMHGLFTDDMGVYREDSNGKPQYNWQYIDELYDFLHSIGMKPFASISSTGYSSCTQRASVCMARMLVGSTSLAKSIWMLSTGLPASAG